MKKVAIAVIVMVVVAMAVMMVGGLAMAENWAKTAGQTLEGRNADCPFLGTLYVAKTFKEVPIIENIGANVRIEGGYTSSMRAITKDNTLYAKAGLEF